MRHRGRWLGVVLLTALSAVLGGCQLVGGMAASAERTGSTTVAAKYSKLAGRDFAVIVASDRGVQGEHPDLVPMITREVTRRLAENTGAKGMVPAEDILRFQYQRPGWVAMSALQLAKELEVQRLVFIDLQDYALSDAGNMYIWNGVAAGTVSVLETDSAQGAAGEFSFRQPIRVRFPDQEGMSEYQIPRGTMVLELNRRFINRASWLFYSHEEPNAIKY